MGARTHDAIWVMWVFLVFVFIAWIAWKGRDE
jgi:hypothetical protein